MSAKPRDLNSLAATIVAEATDEPPEKDPVAVERGRLGGRTRAGRMTAEERSKDARTAATARWAKKAAK